MVEFILIPLTLLAIGVASYADIKTREVPDWLNYSLLFAALGIRAIFAVEEGWLTLLSGVIGAAFCFALASLFYYTHQWGGGDSKLLIALGAVIGISLPFSPASFTLLWFFLALLFVGAVYGLGWMGFIAIRKKQAFVPAWMKEYSGYKMIHYALLTLTLLLAILAIIMKSIWPLVFFPLGVFYLFLFVHTVEQSCFRKEVSPLQLTEGDWLESDVVVDKKTILAKKTLGKEDIIQLQSLAKQKKLATVTIKEGIPFIPSFLFAYLALLFGNTLIPLLFENWFL